VERTGIEPVTSGLQSPRTKSHPALAALHAEVPPEPYPKRLAADSDAWPDNEIAACFVWLFQKLFHTQARWTNCSAEEEQKDRVCGAFVRALFRTRTGDPLLTPAGGRGSGPAPPI
jgi:hypothetical protein